MKKIIYSLILILLFFSIGSFAQKKTVINADSIKILQFEQNLQRKVDSLAQENTALKEYIKLGYENIREDSRRTLTAIQIILTVFAVLMASLGIIIGFGAPTYLKKKADEKVDAKVNEKITDEVIKKKIQEEGGNKIIELTNLLDKNAKEIIEKSEKELTQKIHDLEDLSIKYRQGLSELDDIKNKRIEDYTPEEKVKLEKFSETLSEFKEEKNYSAIDWFWKAYDEFTKKQYDKAIEYFNKSLELSPELNSSLIMRALSYFNLEEYPKAIKDYNELIVDNPETDYDNYTLRGYCYQKMGENEKAESDFKKAKELKELGERKRKERKENENN